MRVVKVGPPQVTGQMAVRSSRTLRAVGNLNLPILGDYQAVPNGFYMLACSAASAASLCSSLLVSYRSLAHYRPAKHSTRGANHRKPIRDAHRTSCAGARPYFYSQGRPRP